MEESGVSKLISVRLGQEEEPRRGEEPAQRELLDRDGSWEEEEVEIEEGRELPIGVDDPGEVREEDIHPIRARQQDVFKTN